MGSIFLNATNEQAAVPLVKNGYIDLSTVNWQQTPEVDLKGEWVFYWKQLFIPTTDTLNEYIEKKYQAPMPGPWTKIYTKDSLKLPAQGFGTYQLNIKVKNKSQVYGLKVHRVFTAYNLYYNGVKIKTQGIVGKTKQQSQPKFKTQEIALPVQKKGDATYQNIELVFQVSNFHHRRAGLRDPITFAPIENIISQTKNNIILNLLIIGIILIIGINHVMMYLLRRLDLSNLLFGLLCVIMILRNLSTGEIILLHWFPEMDWELIVRLDNFSGFATIAFFAFFFYFQHRSYFPKAMFYTILGIGLAITGLVFGSKAWFYGQFRMVFELYILLGGLYLTFGVLLRAAIHKKTGAFMSFLGMFILYATAINDVLSSMGLIESAYVAPYGLATFMVVQSFLLTRHSANALKQNQELSAELSEEKEKLEERIKERTQKLSQQANELETYKETQQRQIWINEGLNLINDKLRENKDNLELLADSLLSIIIKRVDGALGALYFLMKKEDKEMLMLLANFGLSKEAIETDVDTREGLTGKCFSNGSPMYIDELPDRFFEISSGLGNALPKSLALIPLIVDEKVTGVLEVASFKPLKKRQKEFLEKTVVNIAAQLNILKMNNETTNLLKVYKEHETELKQKEEEFRQMKEELEVLREKQSSV